MNDSNSLARRAVLEWFSITSKILILILSMSLISSVVLWNRLDPTVHDRSLVGLFNRFSVYAGLSKADTNLLTALLKYQEEFQNKARNRAYPRVILQPLRGWSGQQPAQYLKQRVEKLEYNNERLRVDCDNKHLLQNLLCYFQQPQQQKRVLIEQLLSGFAVVNPKVNGSYGNGWELAIGYDLARAIPELSTEAAEKAQLKITAALTEHLQLLDGSSASLWHGRSTIAASAFLLAAVLDLDKPEHKQLFSRSYGHFSDVVSALTATETWPEGFNYWLQERGMPIALGLAAFKNAATDEAVRDRLDRLMRRIGLWHIYLTRPDNRIEGWADEGSRSDLKDGTRRIIDILAHSSRDPMLARYSYYLKNLHPQSSYYHGRLWQTLLFHDPSIVISALADVRTLSDVMGADPSAELFGSGYSNHLIIRSGWGPGDTFISYRASDIFTHHQHYDAGHFTLFKQAPLAVNSSTYGDFFGSHRLNYAIRTIAKNSLLIVDSEERITPNKFFTTNVIDGGQRIVIPTGSAIASFDHWLRNRNQGTNFGTSELLDYESFPGVATYIKTDITRAYNSIRFDANGGAGKVKRVIRELLYLYQEDSLVVRDEVVTTSVAHKVRWLLHTYNKFESDQHRLLKGSLEDGVLKTPNLAEGVQTQHQGSKLKLNIIEPNVTEITQVGGTNHRYFIAEPGSEITGVNYTEGSSADSWFEQPHWRTEIESNATGNRHKFLIVLQPRDKEIAFLTVDRFRADEQSATGHEGDQDGLQIGNSVVMFGEQQCPDSEMVDDQAKQWIFVGMPGCFKQIKRRKGMNNRLLGNKTLFVASHD